ncbi:hypothetical protein DL96DRAFT_1553172 [Flagelloscypha sp. PMI_526]|nr:hypothetical protein DL96DRAFT_1553172 [Flagelloscypha sp. PMI_526]
MLVAKGRTSPPLDRLNNSRDDPRCKQLDNIVAKKSEQRGRIVNYALLWRIKIVMEAETKTQYNRARPYVKYSSARRLSRPITQSTHTNSSLSNSLNVMMLPSTIEALQIREDRGHANLLEFLSHLVKLRRTFRTPTFPSSIYTFKHTNGPLGCDADGDVVAIGARVTHFSVGDRAAGFPPQPGANFCVGIGQHSILIWGAPTAVGHYAIWLLSLSGYRVIIDASPVIFDQGKAWEASDVLDYETLRLPRKLGLLLLSLI